MYLRFKKNDVYHLEFSCIRVIYRLEWILYRALTMTCEKVDFQVSLYEKPCIPFERSQKVIQRTFKRNISISHQK